MFKEMQVNTVYSQIVDGALKLYKGTNPDMDSYSAFFDNIRSSGSTGNMASIFFYIISLFLIVHRT